MRLLNKGLTESIYNSILNEGSFGDEVGFGDFSSIDEMEEEFTNKLYSFFGKEPSDLNFSRFELHRGTSWTDSNPWMLVEATGLDDIFEDIIIEKGKTEYPNLYNLYQEDGLVFYETGLEMGRNHGDRNYFDVVVYNTTDIHYLTYDEMSSDQAKALEKKVDEETNRICAYMEGIIKEHYQELLDIMLNNEYIDEDDEMYESKKVRKSKKLNESDRELEFGEDGRQKIFYFVVGICLDENRPNAHEEDFYDMPDFGIPYKLLDENFGVTYNRGEAIKYVQHYIKDGVAGTFGAVIEASAPEGVNITQTISAGWADWIDFSDIYHFKKAGGKLIYCGYSKGENGKDIQNLVGRMLIESSDIKGPTLDKDSNYYCEWCGTKFKADKKADGSMPNCPTCYKKRYKDDPKRDEDGHANKDVHLIESAKVKEKFGKNITYEDLEDMVYAGGDDSDAAVIFDDIGYKLKSNDLLDLINKKKLTNKEDILDFIVNSEEVNKLRESLKEATDEDMAKLVKELKHRADELEMKLLTDEDFEKIAKEIKAEGFFISNDIFTDDNDEYEWEKINDFLDKKIMTYFLKNSGSEHVGEHQYVCNDCGLEFDEDQLTSTDDDGNDLCPACGSTDIVDTGDEELEESVGGKKEFKVGDKVKLRYISDNNEHNDKVGELTWIHKFKYYPNKNPDEFVYKYQGVITYPDGTEEMVYDLYRDGSGLVSPLEIVNESSDEAKRAPIRKYTAYVFNWINDHGYVDEFKKVWEKYAAPEYDGMSTEEIMKLVFEELADENGFNGELFVSPDEFYNNEGLEESVELTKFEWKDGLDGFEYYTDPDKDIYAKNIKSGRLYFCTSDGDPDVEIEDDSKYIIKENVDELESIGSIEEIDGKMYYVSDSTNNGFCYKDAKAYNNEPDKICYLCEAAFDESEDGKIAVDYVEANKERLVDWGSAETKNSIREQVKTMFEVEEYWYESDSGERIEAKDFDDELVDQIADDAFSMVDWQTVNGFLLEREWNEAVEEYYDKKFGTLKESEYVEVDSKSVQDSDGFTTDYTMYKDENGKYVFVFGDKDLYKPEDGDFDWEAETEEEAREWFDSYKGLNEAAKPKKKKAKKKKEDERRVIMQQGNVTCFKENDNKFLVFENENDNEKEYPDQDSAMEDFMARVGVDTDRELKESVTLAGKKFPVRKRPLKETTKYGDTNPDEISPDAYLRIEDREDGSKYVDAGIGDHTSLGGGQYSKYPDGEVSRLYKEVRSKAKEKKVKVHDKLKNDVGYYDEIIPKYNADIEQDLKDLEPYRDRPLKRKELDMIRDITGRRDASGSSERQMKHRMSGDYGRLMTKVNDLKRNLDDLDQDGVKEIWIN